MSPAECQANIRGRCPVNLYAVKKRGPIGPPFKINLAIMNKINFFFLSFICVFFATDFSYAQQVTQQPTQEKVQCQPTYGDYWQSDKWGWYGAKRIVRTSEEAQEILQKIFMHHHWGVKVVRMTERPHFFIAEVVNDKGVLIDLILIDRRTGRIRSMF
jgi:hypothetical protein